MLLIAALAGCGSPPASSQEQNRSAVFQLEQQPLRLPALGTDGSCPQTPKVAVQVYFNPGQTSTWTVFGQGPIYGQGGLPLLSEHGNYFSVTYLSDPTYHGAALVRGRKLDGTDQVLFAGALASGNQVKTETIGGKSTSLYGELVIPAERQATTVWRQWQAIQGVAGPGCYGFEVDGSSFQEIVVVRVLPSR